MSAFQVTIESGIAELVFDKPPVNAFNSAEWASIATKITDLGSDKTVHVIIIRALPMMRPSTMQQKFYHPGHMCLLAKKRKGLKSFLAESREKN